MSDSIGWDFQSPYKSDSEGRLLKDGQAVFPVYGTNSALAVKYVSFRLVDGKPLGYEVTL